MGLKRIKISQLRLAEILKGLFTIGYQQNEDGSTESVQIGLEFVGDAADNANTAAKTANSAAKKANASAKEADRQAGRAKDQADHPPMMGENGNWWKWDEKLQEYVDTGVLAKGGVLYPNFYIDTDTMELFMAYQDEIAADQFVLEEGCLCFKMR